MNNSPHDKDHNGLSDLLKSAYSDESVFVDVSSGVMDQITQEDRLLDNVFGYIRSEKSVLEIDVWPRIDGVLDECYHREISDVEGVEVSDSVRERFHINMSAYVDGELSPSSCLAISEHLGECVSCRGYLSSLVQMQRVVKYSHQDDISGINDELFWSVLESRVFGDDVSDKKIS